MPKFVGHSAREELDQCLLVDCLGWGTPCTVQFIILGQLYERPQVIFPVFQEPLDVVFGARRQEHTRECEHLPRQGGIFPASMR